MTVPHALILASQLAALGDPPPPVEPPVPAHQPTESVDAENEGSHLRDGHDPRLFINRIWRVDVEQDPGCRHGLRFWRQLAAELAPIVGHDVAGLEPVVKGVMSRRCPPVGRAPCTVISVTEHDPGRPGLGGRLALRVDAVDGRCAVSLDRGTNLMRASLDPAERGIWVLASERPTVMARRDIAAAVVTAVLLATATPIEEADLASVPLPPERHPHRAARPRATPNP